MIALKKLSIECRSFSELVQKDLKDWYMLLAEVEVGGAFMSPTFFQAVYSSGGGDPRIIFLRRGDSVVGVIGFRRMEGLLGLLGCHEPVGGEMSDYFGLVAKPDVVINWIDLLKACAVPCLNFTHLDEGQRRHGLHGDAPRLGLRTVIHSDGGAAHWTALRQSDKKLASDTDRRERKLAQDFSEPIFQISSLTPSDDLHELIRLKKIQYLRTGKKRGALLESKNARLLECLLLNQDQTVRPLLSTLKIGDQLIAAHFGILFAGTLHYWFPVYDEAFAAYSPGRLLIKRILNSSEIVGIRNIDRGEGDTPAKREFSNESHKYYRGLEWHGTRGLFAALALRMYWRFKH